MSQHERINYVEFPASDLAATKAFFRGAFGWQFTDYGPDYCAFDQQGIEGGFFHSDKVSRSINGAALLVLYSEDLEATQAKIEAHGGQIIEPIFPFPGGRRFHFCEPSGNELAVWSDVGCEAANP